MNQFIEKDAFLRLDDAGKDPINANDLPTSSNNLSNGSLDKNDKTYINGGTPSSKTPVELKNSSSGKRKSAKPRRLVDLNNDPIPIVKVESDLKLSQPPNFDPAWFLPQMNSTFKEMADILMNTSPSTSKSTRVSANASDSGFDSSVAGGISMDDILSAYNESLANILFNGSSPSTDTKNFSMQSLSSSLKNSTPPTPEELQKFLTTWYASSNDVNSTTSPEALLASFFTNTPSTSKDTATEKSGMLELRNTPITTNEIKHRKVKQLNAIPNGHKSNAENSPNGELQPKKKIPNRVSKKRRADQKLPVKPADVEGMKQERPTSRLSGSPSANESFDIDDIESFAHYFKKQRVKLGFTQGDVGAALGKRWGADFSQTTISRFEALNLSFKNMCKLRPLLRDWLIEAEKAIASGATVAEILGNPVESNSSSKRSDYSDDGEDSHINLPPGVALLKKRRKRTNLDNEQKAALDTFFTENCRPDHSQMSEIAQKLNLDHDVVRVWFCNRRQKLRKE